MKFIKTILLSVLVIVIFSFVGLYCWVRANGKQLIEQKLSDIFKRPVQVKKVSLSLPFTLNLDKIEIPELLKIHRAQFEMGIPFIFENRWRVSKLSLFDPEIEIHRKESPLSLRQPSLAMNGSQDVSSQNQQAYLPKGKAGRKANRGGILTQNLQIENGKLSYFFQSEGKTHQIIFKKISLRAKTFAYPLIPLDTRFDLTATVESDQLFLKTNILHSIGWINWLKKDLESTLKITEPTGEEYLSLALKSNNNDLLVKGQLSLQQFLNQHQSKGEGSLPFEDFLVGPMQATGVDLKTNFSFQTKMDDFHLESIPFSADLIIRQEESDSPYPND